MKKLTIFLTQILACGLLAAPSSAQFIPQATAIPGSAPEGINYQGRLEDGGFPVNATKSMIFRVYTAPVGGVLLWTSPTQAVPVALGLFSAVVPVPTTVLVGGGARYLEVSIDGTLMSPRELLNSVPYALIAKSVEGNIDVSTAGLSINANSTAPQPALYISSVTGNVGIGTGAPITAFDVGGSAQFGSGTTKSTFSATGALNTAGKVTAPDYTATYGINASTAVVIYVQSSSITTTGNVNIQGSLGVGTPAPGTKLHLSSGVLTIDGNATNALTTVGRVGIGTALPGSKLHLSTGTLIIDGNTATALTTIGSVGVGTALPGSKLHMSSGTLTIDGNTATSLTTTGNVGVGTSLPASRLHISTGTLIIDGGTANSLTTTGNVGVGTSFPASRLHMSSGTLIIDGSGPTSLTTTGSIGVGTPVPASKLHMSSGTVIIDGNTATALTTVGNVGVGTSLPTSKLHLSSGTLIIDGNTAASILTTGSVGVGTTTPALPLHVVQGLVASIARFENTNSTNIFDLTYGGSLKHTFNTTDSRYFLSSNMGVDIGIASNDFGGLALGGAGQYSAISSGGGGLNGGTRELYFYTNNDFTAPKMYVTASGRVGIGTSGPASKLHMSSGTIIVDGNVATALTTVGNVGIGTSGSAVNDRLEVAGGNVRLTAVAGSAGSVKMFSILTVGAVTCTAQCGANTMCLAAWDSAGVVSTCGTAAAANRCLCSGFGD